jgi:hypothetical protein
MGTIWRDAILIPVGVALFTIVAIFVISRILLAFNDQAIATGVALGMAVLIMVVATVLDRRPRPNPPH